MLMFINGKPTPASDGAPIDVTNPANGKLVDTVPAATEADIQSAVDAAHAAQPTWAAIPCTRRSTS